MNVQQNNKTPDVTLTLIVNKPQKELQSHPFRLRSFPLKNFVPNMIRQRNINETRQHVGIQTLSTVVMLYPLQKKHAVLRGIMVQRCSRLPIGKSQRQEVQHLKLTMGKGCHYVFVGTLFVSLGDIFVALFCFVCFVFVVLFCLFLFRISSMDHKNCLL